jgi:Phosphoesterase family
MSADPRRSHRSRLRASRRGPRGRIFAVLFVVFAAAAVAVSIPSSSVGSGKTSSAVYNSPPVAAGKSGGNPDDLGIGKNKIKHVWLIILENKSYDATFTGLNHNTYLWKTLPEQGVLLKNYYGTGHFSLDNYISMVSGQATQPDDQEDCPYYTTFKSKLDLEGKLKSNPNYGQAISDAGPNAAGGKGADGCAYPPEVETLFNQFDKAGVSWKGYAQDLGNKDVSGPAHAVGGEAEPWKQCGAPYAEPSEELQKQPNPGKANATDQYVPKHFPFGWFESILDSGDCNEQHIANLFSQTNGLYHDLQSASTTPSFSWITPDNCSDAHDAVCFGNNLSGGFKKGTPLQEATEIEPPKNYTGGLYASDLFLEHVIPEIEESPAFKEGGLIDITFDEGFPPFTYSGNSFYNSKLVAPDAATSLADDSAGETLFGQEVHWEPTGPNTPLETNEAGEQLYPGPGYNAYLDRPFACEEQTYPAKLPEGTCLLGGGSHPPGAATEATSAASPSGSSTIDDNSIVATDKGRTVTGPGIPMGSYVGEVNDEFVEATKSNSEKGFVDTGSFTVVNGAGEPVGLESELAAGEKITLGARTEATDPLFNSTDPTTGGGDTGSVLISPYITPGSVSTRYYNHYSWLRTMEDLFKVKKAAPGLDGKGHIGYAAQPGLAAFGPDVFNNPKGQKE